MLLSLAVNPQLTGGPRGAILGTTEETAMRTSFKQDERQIQFFDYLVVSRAYVAEILDAAQEYLGADPEMVTLADIENASRLRDELRPIADRLAGRDPERNGGR
jgi:hypothetical protein